MNPGLSGSRSQAALVQGLKTSHLEPRPVGCTCSFKPETAARATAQSSGSQLWEQALAGWWWARLPTPHTECLLSTPLFLTYQPLCPSPQHITTCRQASAVHLATALPSHPPRPLKRPSPGLSALSPLASPSPRPSARKAKAALAGSLCEHSCLLLPCLWAPVRLPGPPRGSPRRVSSHLLPTVTWEPKEVFALGRHRPFPDTHRGHLCPCGMSPSEAGLSLERPSCPHHVSFHLLTCHRAHRLCPPVLFCASMGSEASALPHGLRLQPPQSGQQLPHGSSSTSW